MYADPFDAQLSRRVGSGEAHALLRSGYCVSAGGERRISLLELGRLRTWIVDTRLVHFPIGTGLDIVHRFSDDSDGRLGPRLSECASQRGGGGSLRQSSPCSPRCRLACASGQCMSAVENGSTSYLCGFGCIRHWRLGSLPSGQALVRSAIEATVSARFARDVGKEAGCPASLPPAIQSARRLCLGCDRRSTTDTAKRWPRSAASYPAQAPHSWCVSGNRWVRVRPFVARMTTMSWGCNARFRRYWSAPRYESLAAPRRSSAWSVWTTGASSTHRMQVPAILLYGGGGISSSIIAMLSKMSSSLRIETVYVSGRERFNILCGFAAFGTGGWAAYRAARHSFAARLKRLFQHASPATSAKRPVARRRCRRQSNRRGDYALAAAMVRRNGGIGSRTEAW